MAIPCAVYNCTRPGILKDPRPVRAGFYYLCREHLTPAEIAWLRAGAPMHPAPTVTPGRRGRRRR